MTVLYSYNAFEQNLCVLNVRFHAMVYVADDMILSTINYNSIFIRDLIEIVACFQNPLLHSYLRIGVYLIPGMPDEYTEGNVDQHVFDLHADLMLDQMIERYTRDIPGCIVLLDSTSWQRCRYLKSHTSCMIDTATSKWDDGDDFDSPENVFGRFMHIDAISDNILLQPGRVYAYHGAVHHVIANSLAHPIMFIMADADAVLATIRHDYSSHITSILLCSHNAEHEAPRIDYRHVPVSHCIECISSMELVPSVIAAEHPLMYIPPQLGTYL